MSAATATPLTDTRVEFDDDVEARRGDDAGSYDGWFCVATAPWPCPAEGCGFVALHLTAAHLVVVFPRVDDPMLLAAAANAKYAGRSPRVVSYERALGPCIPVDEWMRIGSPVHGMAAKPDGWDGRARSRL